MTIIIIIIALLLATTNTTTTTTNTTTTTIIIILILLRCVGPSRRFPPRRERGQPSLANLQKGGHCDVQEPTGFAVGKTIFDIAIRKFLRQY